MYRVRDGGLEVLLVHPGGPYWAKKDVGSWSIPKGEYNPEEAACDAALREFEEETGIRPSGEPLPLGEERQCSGKRVSAFALEGDLDTDDIRSDSFEIEWPPRSGQMRSFPEVDRAQWFAIDIAKKKILAGQAPFLDRLLEKLGI